RHDESLKRGAPRPLSSCSRGGRAENRPSPAPFRRLRPRDFACGMRRSQGSKGGVSSLRISTDTMKKFLLFVGCLLTAQSLLAWGQKGHDVVAYIAECHLAPEAAERIEKVL